MGDTEEVAGEPAAEEPAAEEPAATKEPEPSLLAGLSPEDKKLLMLTFAGTVAANIITVAVVGIALGLARLWFSPPISRPHPNVPGVVILLCVMLALYVATIIFSVRVSRKPIRPALGVLGRKLGWSLAQTTAYVRRVTIGGIVVLGAVAVLLTLILLGVAAGVR
jgi:hypothetical protein